MKRVLTNRLFPVLAIMFLLFSQFSYLSPQQVSAAPLSNGATVSVLDKDGEEVIPMTAVEIKPDEKAFDVIEKVAEKQGIDLQYTEDPNWGAFITEIGAAIPQNSDYFGFFINGKDAPVGVSGYTVKNGDNLLFKIVSYPAETVDLKVSSKNKQGEFVIPETSVSVVNGANAYDALVQAAGIHNVQIDVAVDSAFFTYVNNIGSTQLDASSYDYWSSSINSEVMQVGLSSYGVQNNDSLALDVVSYTPPSEEDPNSGDDTPTDDDTDPIEPENPDSNDSNLDAISKQQVETIINSSLNYLLENGGNSEFEAVAIKSSGVEVPGSYLENIIKTLEGNNGEFRNVTDYERMALGVSAAGQDATNVADYNLIEKIYANERMANQGANGVIYALLAYDSRNYHVPADAKWTRENLVNYLLENQSETGGWALFGTNPSVDITGMALAALAPYQDQASVKTAIERAVEWLSTEQDENSGYDISSNGGNASETTSQVIIGLTSVGVDPTSQQFTKSGGNLLQHLISFQQNDGGFSHVATDDRSNLMATTQSLLALNSYQHYLDGEGSIYQFGPVEGKELDDSEKPEESDDQEDANGNHGENVDEDDKGSDVNKDNETKTTENTSSSTASASKQSHDLPDTATNQFNLLLVGGVLLVIGTGLYLYRTKNQSRKI